MLVGSEKLCVDAPTAKDEFDCIAVLRFGPLACDGFAMNSIVATKGKTLTNFILIEIYKREQSGKATECELASNGQVLASLESDSWIRNVRSQTRAMLRNVAPFCSVGRFCARFDILCVSAHTHACIPSAVSETSPSICFMFEIKVDPSPLMARKSRTVLLVRSGC
jgi:hypothetical protein